MKPSEIVSLVELCLHNVCVGSIVLLFGLFKLWISLKINFKYFTSLSNDTVNANNNSCILSQI